MGNIVEKIGAMVARLGTKLANNYGGTASNRYILLHAPAGSNNERLDPNCAMSLNEFAQVLGAKVKQYVGTGTADGMPSNYGVLVEYGNDWYAGQLFFQADGVLFDRAGYGNPKTWTSWYKIQATEHV